ncbi:MAG: molybdopterin cofactor-binding domain-containing protein [Pseudomonadota bacterium]
MGKIAKITRRTLLVGAVAVTGGFAVGYYAYKRDPGNPLADNLPEGSETLNPYLRIDRDGVTIITPRTECGQGVHTALAALVAEELDLAWEAIRVETGPPSVAYYNGKVLAEGLPFAAIDGGWSAERARGFADVLGKLLGIQMTGGSSSVPDAYDKMRRAGAAAREMLLSAAAERSGQSRRSLTTRDGHVVLADGSRLAYTELAQEAARIEPPADPELKPPAQWRYLGKPMQRVDTAAKATGTAAYGIDVERAGMRYAAVVTNPAIGSSGTLVDDTAARARRGVLDVVPITGGAAVVADNTWRAMQAAGALRFDWAPADYPADTAAMIAAVSDAFEGGRDSRLRDDGDVEDTLGYTPLEAEYRVPYLAHAPLEPMTATAHLQPDRLDIWTASQVPMQVRKSAAKLTDLDEDRIHVHTLMAGGSFGRRLEDDYIKQAIEIAITQPGVPVKMTWSREHDMTHDFCRPLAIARGRGAVAGGKVTAFDLGVAAASVTRSQAGRAGLPFAGPDVMIVAGAWDQPYAIPNYRVTGYHAEGLAPVSSWRSVGASVNGFFHDCFMDELLAAASVDAVEGRLAHLTDAPSRAVIEAVADMSSWGGALPEGHARGIGFCLSFGVPCATVIEVSRQGERVRIEHAWVAADVGTVLDPDNVDAQLSGGTLFGLGHAMFGEITFTNAAITQTNFHSFRSLRFHEAPPVTTRALENQTEIRGIGEPAVPPAAPALANAIFAATGQRLRELPFANAVAFSTRV